MLTGVHFLLTYNCTFECDHCFLCCGPFVGGTFTLEQLHTAMAQIRQIDSIYATYFEGGEPFLYYPLMLEGLRLAKKAGLKTGIVSNAYWATSVPDAELWLKPIVPLQIADLSVSDDLFHHEDKDDNPAKHARKAAERLNIPAGSICIEEPTVRAETEREKGEPVIGGGAMFKGRAAEKLVEGLPRRSWLEFTTCPHEELEHPKRVHIDPYGHVHLCQGISMGNMWQTPLAELDANYDASKHPICGPLVRGGPAELAREYDVPHDDGYVDECHFCYTIRKALLDRFPDHLCPRQVYCLTEDEA